MKSMYVILICIVHLRFIYSCGEEMDAESIISLRKYKLLSRASVRTIFCVLNVRLFFACVIFASRLESLARTTRQSNVSNMITVSTNRLVNWKFSRRQTPRDDLFSSFYSLSLSLSHTLLPFVFLPTRRQGFRRDRSPFGSRRVYQTDSISLEKLDWPARRIFCLFTSVLCASV